MSTSSSFMSKILRLFNSFLPNCEKAIELAEIGQKRDLSLAEKASLKYNSRLCPFCACAEIKVNTEIRKMKDCEANRNNGS